MNMNNPIQMVNNLLSPEKENHISSIVDNILSNIDLENDSTAYLLDIAYKNDIRVLQSDLRDVSGILRKSKKDNIWEIIVNEGESRVRKLFSIAHELGHYFLHKEESIDGGIYRDNANRFEKKEVEANEFAGQVLMPKKIIEDIIGQKRPIDNNEVVSLSDRFGVSSIAMSIRLKNLEYTLA